MSQNDDSMLDEFLDGKSDLSKVYQQGKKQQPPADLDARILAQAQQAVEGGKRHESQPGLVARRPRWLVPASLAATLMLGINLAYNLKDTSPDAPYAENSVVIVDDQFEAKRQQATARKNQAIHDSVSDTQPSAQSMQKINAQLPAEANVAGHDEASVKKSETETLVQTSSGFRTAPTAPATSPEPRVRSIMLEAKQQSSSIGTRRDSALSEPDVTTERETSQDVIAYAPAPEWVAMNSEKPAPDAIESPAPSTDTVAAPRDGMPVTRKEISQSHAAIAGFELSAEENRNAQDADDSEHYTELSKDSLASTTTVPAPSKNSQSEGQNRNFYQNAGPDTQIYLCDLATLGVSDTEIAEKTLALSARQSQPSESIWENSIVDSASRGEYRQACLELAAFRKRYPDTVLPEDFPVRFRD